MVNHKDFIIFIVSCLNAENNDCLQGCADFFTVFFVKKMTFMAWDLLYII